MAEASLTPSNTTPTRSGKQIELLIFTLKSSQDYAVDIFKTREIITLEKLNRFPGMHASVIGVTTIRNQTLPVIDLEHMLSGKPIQDTTNATLIVTELDGTNQALLVHQVKHIACITSAEVNSAQESLGKNHYITATAQIDNRLTQLIDLEKILNTIKPHSQSHQ
ncbi:chemotaxis protein CheW [Piscirickettsia litoralis]|uniref:CheW-like domain-containing protein n=1 Tax=Piscirickettsia litoralis TaxID=1891921 RepID=A0ABX3A706_9GAMM|nr:chemotaxis protein CheW [Piscirickettsia litoralis]ODN43225.1 hypothetical protein BGC07_10230 [Piscirickettsia litoralis]